MAGASPVVEVRGLAELQRAFDRADDDLQREFVRQEQSIAEPVRATAQTLALTQIPNMPRSPGWAEMRSAVGGRVAYIAPVNRGGKGRSGKRGRPNLADMLLERAMIPALERHASYVQRRFDDLIGNVEKGWER